jgi:[ribosomal protein S18]-alanine N-acetyltransferase
MVQPLGDPVHLPEHFDTAFSIQPMLTQHIEAVLEIERAVAPHPWTPGIFGDELANPDTRSYYVVRHSSGPDQAGARSADGAGDWNGDGMGDGAVLVGFGGVLVQVGEAHITNIAVAPSYRRRGLARMLMVVLMRRAIERQATAATLEVRVSNVAAQRLYHRFGFVPAGVRPRYYPDGEDAVIMWADDIATQPYVDRLQTLDGLEVFR